MNSIINLLAILTTVLGAMLLAWDIIRPFTGTTYKVEDTTYRGSGQAEKTPEYIAWETKYRKKAFLGFVLIVISAILQTINL